MLRRLSAVGVVRAAGGRLCPQPGLPAPAALQQHQGPGDPGGVVLHHPQPLGLQPEAGGPLPSAPPAALAGGTPHRSARPTAAANRRLGTHPPAYTPPPTGRHSVSPAERHAPSPAGSRGDWIPPDRTRPPGADPPAAADPPAGTAAAPASRCALRCAGPDGRRPPAAPAR